MFTRPRALVALSILLGLLVSLVGVESASAAVTITASPTGTGTSCSATAPCSAVTALSKARGGDTVLLLAGAYGSPMLYGVGGSSAARVTVRPATGALVSFSKLQTYVPYATWSGITVTSLLYVYPSAVGTIIDGLTMQGAGSYLRGNDTIVRNSLFQGGVGIDAVQIKNVSNVRLEHNTIRNYSVAVLGDVHVDCIQVFDASKVVLVRNAISNCSNAGITLSPGIGLGIQGVTIQSNFIQGCVVVSSTCLGGAALDVREVSATGVIVRSNTIVNGATRAVPRTGIVVDRNVIEYLADCTAPVTNSVIKGWNTGSCAQLAALGADGNRAGTVGFVNQTAGDLHIVDVVDVTVEPCFARSGTVLGYDGYSLLGSVAGADQ
jgi:hypothetical protein